MLCFLALISKYFILIQQFGSSLLAFPSNIYGSFIGRLQSMYIAQTVVSSPLNRTSKVPFNQKILWTLNSHNTPYFFMVASAPLWNHALQFVGPAGLEACHPHF